MSKPRNRLATEAIKVCCGGAKAYLHIDRDPLCGNRVEHIIITANGKHGSDFQQLCVELSRLINRALIDQPEENSDGERKTLDT